MLDIMEMRGFGPVIDHREELYLRTPDGYSYYVQRIEHTTDIKCFFTMFQRLNQHYK